MFEKILQEGETVAIHEDGAYCGDGAVAPVKAGQIALTNKRLLVLKLKTGSVGTTIGIIVAIAIIIPVIWNSNMGYIGAALFGSVVGGLCGFIGNIIEQSIRKKKQSTAQLTDADIVHAFQLQELAKVEDGNRGVRKMLVVTTKSGEVCKIDPGKTKEEWREAISKSIQA